MSARTQAFPDGQESAGEPDYPQELHHAPGSPASDPFADWMDGMDSWNSTDVNLFIRGVTPSQPSQEVQKQDRDAVPWWAWVVMAGCAGFAIYHAVNFPGV